MTLCHTNVLLLRSQANWKRKSRARKLDHRQAMTNPMNPTTKFLKYMDDVFATESVVVIMYILYASGTSKFTKR